MHASTTQPRAGLAAAVVSLCLAGMALSGCAAQDWTPVSTSSAFGQQLGGTQQPVMVEFYENGCPWCFALAPVLGDLSREYRGRVVFLRVEPSEGAAVMSQYNVSAYPTVVLFHGGTERSRWVGGRSKEVYTQALDAALAERSR